MTKVTHTVEFLDGGALLSETRDVWSTPLGPVVHRTNDAVYIARTAGDGEFRAGEQFDIKVYGGTEAQFSGSFQGTSTFRLGGEINFAMRVQPYF